MRPLVLACALALLFPAPAHALLLDLIPGNAPAGWPYGIVPANATFATGVAPVLPAQLEHLTRFNWSVSQNSTAGTWRDEFWIDGVLTQMVTRSGVSAIGWPYYWLETNTGPIYIQGGRHTLEIHTDPDGTSGEDRGSLYNNVYRIPFIWTPTTITPATSTVTLPPQGDFTAPSPNCNAYAWTRTPGTAWVASISARSLGAQAALLVYDDYTNSTTGLHHEIGRATPSGIAADFVVGSSESPATFYPSCARMPGSPAVSVNMAVADAALHTAESGNATWPSVNMPKLTNAQVFEAYFTQGVDQTMTVTRFMGEDLLEIRVFGPGTTIANRSAAQWVSTLRNGNDQYSDLVFTPPITGTFLVVVSRIDAANIDTALGYTLTLTMAGTVGASPGFAAAPLAAAPTPSTGPMRLSFTLPRPEHVSLALYDVQGRAVRTLVDETLPAGPVTRTWDGTNDDGRTMAAGRYFARLVAGSRRETLAIVRF